MAEIRIENVSKVFSGVPAVNDVSLTIKDREFMVLLGPSGCGKTTLLRLIAGFEVPDQGSIYIGDRDVTGDAPGRRGISMVFQSYALFPHLTVFENVAFGLRMHHVANEDLRRRVERSAGLMQIGDYLKRYPSQLSGGQRQRVAVARALVMEPAVILMDEPLSNLDALLRQHMRAELKRLLQEVETTTVYVTHDQIEALSMGDRTAVMRSGRVLQCASPMDVYDRPADPFVAGFIGTPPMNMLAAEAVKAGIRLEGAELPLAEMGAFRPGDRLQVGIRAENIEVAKAAADGWLETKVAVVEPLGSHLLLTLRLGSQQLKVTTRVDFDARVNERLWVRFDPAHIRLLGMGDDLPEAARGRAGSVA